MVLTITNLREIRNKVNYVKMQLVIKLLAEVTLGENQYLNTFALALGLIAREKQP